jgi:hypothetical protein
MVSIIYDNLNPADFLLSASCELLHEIIVHLIERSIQKVHS